MDTLSSSSRRRPTESFSTQNHEKYQSSQKTSRIVECCDNHTHLLKRPPKCRLIYVGRLSQHISVTKIQEYCKTNDIELLHIGQTSRAESLLKTFHCVLKFKDKKVESAAIWPENITVSKYYLIESASEWLKTALKIDV